MPRLSCLATALVAVLAVGGCDLDVENPNAPDAPRAFSDPAGLAQLLGGAFRTWVTTRGDYFGPLPMTAMADNYTASWNNAAIRFYSSVGVECPSRCGWTNSATAPEAAGGPTVESGWYGYYSVLSSANDVLRGIADGICFDDDCDDDNTITSRNTAIAKMLQGMALAGIALVYDKGFVVDETTELPEDPHAYPAFNTRQEMRNAAFQKFEEAWTEAGLNTWDTESEWMGVGSGTAYTNVQIRKLIRTMQAELLALYPRDPTENAQVRWDSVALLASQGISAAPAFDWEFYVDVTGRECILDCVKTWGNSILTMRVDTRLASQLASNHQHPWPGGSGNPCPTTSADRRVGDGTYTASALYGTAAKTANAGTDFACATTAIFPAARGQYHQSNLQHVRYQHLAYRGENLPGFNGTGQDPFYTRQMNDLLWAEGLIRGTPQNKVLAAEKINNSRNGRGGLPLLTGLEADAVLLDALRYEQEIEFMGQGATPFFNRRRRAPSCANPCSGVDGLINDTPRHMPVPGKELDVLAREIYTFGGPSLPDMSAGVDGAAGSGVRSVREIWEEYMALRRSLSARRQ